MTNPWYDPISSFGTQAFIYGALIQTFNENVHAVVPNLDSASMSMVITFGKKPGCTDMDVVDSEEDDELRRIEGLMRALANQLSIDYKQSLSKVSPGPWRTPIANRRAIRGGRGNSDEQCSWGGKCTRQFDGAVVVLYVLDAEGREYHYSGRACQVQLSLVCGGKPYLEDRREYHPYQAGTYKALIPSWMARVLGFGEEIKQAFRSDKGGTLNMLSVYFAPDMEVCFKDGELMPLSTGCASWLSKGVIKPVKVGDLDFYREMLPRDENSIEGRLAVRVVGGWKPPRDVQAFKQKWAEEQAKKDSDAQAKQREDERIKVEKQVEKQALDAARPGAEERLQHLKKRQQELQEEVVGDGQNACKARRGLASILRLIPVVEEEIAKLKGKM